MSLEKLVDDLEEEAKVLVRGVYCKQCECFHYELGTYTIFEFLVGNKERDDSETVGKYITDYDVKMKEQELVT